MILGILAFAGDTHVCHILIEGTTCKTRQLLTCKQVKLSPGSRVLGINIIIFRRLLFVANGSGRIQSQQCPSVPGKQKPYVSLPSFLPYCFTSLMVELQPENL
jgi:hypothetical protein